MSETTEMFIYLNPSQEGPKIIHITSSSSKHDSQQRSSIALYKWNVHMDLTTPTSGS